MTIKLRLFISLALILSITVFIIGVFFYSIYNFNEIHLAQKHRYDQIRRVEKLKDYNNSFSWIVLDIITDFEKLDVVEKRLNKADELLKNLLLQKKDTIENSESQIEKENLQLIFIHFEQIHKLIRNELYRIILVDNSIENFDKFNNIFDIQSTKTNKLIIDEIKYLETELYKTEQNRNQFIETIKIEVVFLLIIAFILSFLISSKIIQDIKEKLQKLNQGILQLFNDDENTVKVDIGKNNELSEITDNLNIYLEKQHDIIHSREELLRNISHELKTPITKGKFLLEEIKNELSSDKLSNINNVFVDIEDLTSKLLQREKLNYATLNISSFKISSLILDSLSKLSISDESLIQINLDDDFEIKGDKYYLTLALKNLIDNAIKYSKEFPIIIQTQNKRIDIKNIAPKLSNDLIYYTKPFTRDPSQQLGHGLGLNIVLKIIKMHSFKLDYTHKNNYNIFSISF